MGIIVDAESGFPIADPDRDVFADLPLGNGELDDALSTMILSASGWRKIFSCGGEESFTPSISAADSLLIAAAGYTCGEFFKSRSDSDTTTIAIAMDSRPTGPVIADVLVRALLHKKCDVRYLFISAAPEIMALVRQSRAVDGFIYVSASHNPIGHNGLKIGLADGAVLGGPKATDLIHRFKEVCASLDTRERQLELAKSLDGIPAGHLEEVYSHTTHWKHEALKAYSDFSYRVLADSREASDIKNLTDILNLEGAQLTGIVAELNGSARTTSIDRTYLPSIGALVKTVNGEPREITHRIVPEGASLELCRSVLEEEHKRDRRFVVGYVPDNDGDRGNIVYICEDTGTAEILHAQQVFALVVLAELSYAVFAGKTLDRWAVVVNGPTSMIVDRICEYFGVEVIRCEVGEANVVNTARALRDGGRTVRVMGEGSNGGNITFPAEVRDPLNTLGSLIKLLNIRSSSGPFAHWCKISGNTNAISDRFGMAAIVSTLPRFVTTSAYEDRALMSIKTPNHGKLKERYEEIFLAEWSVRRDQLRALAGIETYRAVNYEGTETKIGMGRNVRSGAQKGGLKIEFLNNLGSVKSFIWMRGSGTEPVFRILADVEGSDSSVEEYLLAWQRSMIERADQNLSS